MNNPLNDPHVATLRYQLETDSSLTFDSPAPRQYDTPAFTLRLADGLLTCDMKAHFASAAAARAAVDPFSGLGILILRYAREG